MPHHRDTQKHCNFKTLRGNATGVYRFKVGFQGLTYMPAPFEKSNGLRIKQQKLRSRSPK